jgi:hypothetical protein
MAQGQRSRVGGSIIAAIGGAITLIAFFALPFSEGATSNAAVTGNTIASQMDQLVSEVNAAVQSGQTSLTGTEQTVIQLFHVWVLLLWAGAALAGLSAILGLAGIMIGQSRPIPGRLASGILTAGALTILAVVGQFVSLAAAAAQSQASGGAINATISVLRFGYFVTVAGATLALVGGIEQVRLSRMASPAVAAMPQGYGALPSQPMYPGYTPPSQPLPAGYAPPSQPMYPGYAAPSQPMYPGYAPPSQPIYPGYTQPPQPMAPGYPPQAQPATPGYASPPAATGGPTGGAGDGTPPAMGSPAPWPGDQGPASPSHNRNA